MKKLLIAVLVAATISGSVQAFSIIADLNKAEDDIYKGAQRALGAARNAIMPHMVNLYNHAENHSGKAARALKKAAKGAEKAIKSITKAHHPVAANHADALDQ